MRTLLIDCDLVIQYSGQCASGFIISPLTIHIKVENYEENNIQKPGELLQAGLPQFIRGLSARLRLGSVAIDAEILCRLGVAAGQP